MTGQRSSHTETRDHRPATIIMMWVRFGPLADPLLLSTTAWIEMCAGREGDDALVRVTPDNPAWGDLLGVLLCATDHLAPDADDADVCGDRADPVGAPDSAPCILPPHPSDVRHFDGVATWEARSEGARPKAPESPSPASDLAYELSDLLIASSWLDSSEPVKPEELAKLLTETRAFERRRIEQGRRIAVSCPDGTGPDEPADRGFVCEHQANAESWEARYHELRRRAEALREALADIASTHGEGLSVADAETKAALEADDALLGSSKGSTTPSEVPLKDVPAFAAVDGKMHELWTWAVGLPGYDKKKWQELERAVVELARPKGSIR